MIQLVKRPSGAADGSAAAVSLLDTVGQLGKEGDGAGEGGELTGRRTSNEGLPRAGAMSRYVLRSDVVLTLYFEWSVI